MQPKDRDFFRRIRQAILTNPFSGERLAIDLELTSMSPNQSIEAILERLIQVTAQGIDRVKRSVDGRLNRLSAEDHELLQVGMLFHAFHVYCDKFDTLISQQILQGEESCQVPFANDFLESLHDCGIGKRESLRYFGLFFQMRRAFFFISRITGQSDSVKELRSRLWNNIFTCDIELYERHLLNRLEDFSTMLLGETGTGKGLAAAAIGRSGYIPFDDKRGCFTESFAKAFISINLSQFPEQLIESELFGHRKGAFTGAIDSYKGIFSRCSPHGSIFLDEIGDVEIPVQIKLLKILQERNFTPVGSRKAERFNGRVIAATNQSLHEMRTRGEFREDFYYRLCSDIIEVPPLRKRLTEYPDELTIILSFILSNILGKASPELLEKVGDYIISNQPADYPWPGNIRELEQCVRRYLINNAYDWQDIAADKTSNLAQEIEAGELTAQELLSTYCKSLYQKLGSYEGVARKIDLDRRTVKKYVLQE